MIKVLSSMYGLDSTPAQTSPNTHTYVLGKGEGEKERRGAGRRELIQEEREKTAAQPGRCLCTDTLCLSSDENILPNVCSGQRTVKMQ